MGYALPEDPHILSYHCRELGITFVYCLAHPSSAWTRTAMRKLRLKRAIQTIIEYAESMEHKSIEAFVPATYRAYDRHCEKHYFYIGNDDINAWIEYGEKLRATLNLPDLPNADDALSFIQEGDDALDAMV